MHHKTVKDYMISISNYPTINIDKTIEQAVYMMNEMTNKKGYRWIIAVDDNNNLVGFLTLRSVFEAINDLIPQSGNWMGISTKIQLVKNTPLKKCVRPLINVTVSENDHPVKAAEKILNRRITIVPVVNDRSEIVGIVRPVDLLPFIKELFDKH
jgi:CBS domain-containing protein